MIFAFISAFCWALSYYYCSKLLTKESSFSGLYALMFFPNLAITTYAIIFHRDTLESFLSEDNIKYALAYMVFTVSGGITVALALKESNVFLVNMVEISYPLIIMGILLVTREVNISITQVVGAVITIIGLGLVIK